MFGSILPIVGGLVGSLFGQDNERSTINTSADRMQEGYNKGIDEIKNQYSEIQKLLNPYLQAGTDALGQQRDYLGLNGYQQQQNFLDAMQNSPIFSGLMQQGENAILQNASATGGLRGGNTQLALSKFRPQLLNQLLDQQYSRLGGMTSLGQSGINTLGQLGANKSNAMAELFKGLGQSEASREHSLGKSEGNFFGNILGGVGGLLGGLF